MVLISLKFVVEQEHVGGGKIRQKQWSFHDSNNDFWAFALPLKSVLMRTWGFSGQARGHGGWKRRYAKQAAQTNDSGGE